MENDGTTNSLGEVLKGIRDGLGEAIPGVSSAVRDYKQIKQIAGNVNKFNENKAKKAASIAKADATAKKREEAAQARNDAMIKKGRIARIRQEKAERAKASELMGVDVTNPSHYQLEMPSGIQTDADTGIQAAVPQTVPQAQDQQVTSPTVKMSFKTRGKGNLPTTGRVKFAVPKAPASPAPTTPVARPSVPTRNGVNAPKAGVQIKRPGFARRKLVR